MRKIKSIMTDLPRVQHLERAGRDCAPVGAVRRGQEAQRRHRHSRASVSATQVPPEHFACVSPFNPYANCPRRALLLTSVYKQGNGASEKIR